MVAVALPPSLVPMQPMLGKPFHRPGWVYEEKYDGWRMLAFKHGRRARLISRQGVDHTERFRELADAIAALKAPTLILDGEVCVFDKDLISQFHRCPGPACYSEPDACPPLVTLRGTSSKSAATRGSWRRTPNPPTAADRRGPGSR